VHKSLVVGECLLDVSQVPFAYRFFGSTLWSDMDELILEHQPCLWIHGHTHESFDYEIGKTRVICNPRGYAPIEINKEFKPVFTIEV
jgi:Icc-related predicted phosphoesterase